MPGICSKAASLLPKPAVRHGLQLVGERWLCSCQAVVAAVANSLAGWLTELAWLALTSSVFAPHRLKWDRGRNPVNHLSPLLFGDSGIDQTLNGVIRTDRFSLLGLRELVGFRQAHGHAIVMSSRWLALKV